MWKRYIYYDSAAIGLLGLGSALKKSTKIVNAETFILVKKMGKKYILTMKYHTAAKMNALEHQVLTWLNLKSLVKKKQGTYRRIS